MMTRYCRACSFVCIHDDGVKVEGSGSHASPMVGHGGRAQGEREGKRERDGRTLRKGGGRVREAHAHGEREARHTQRQREGGREGRAWCM